jgi:hypothetical protein
MLAAAWTSFTRHSLPFGPARDRPAPESGHPVLARSGTHLQSAWWKGEWVDEYVYALTAKEWRERRSPG